MKKQILIASTLFLGILGTTAQTNIYNTNGTLTSNRTVGMGSYTLNFDSGTFFINGSTNLVGVGTTTPSAKIDVVRNFGLPSQSQSQSAKVANFASYSTSYLIDEPQPIQELAIINGQNFGNYYTRLHSSYSGSARGFIELGKSDPLVNATATALAFGFNTLTAMRILENGKVFIGNTTTPDGYKLFVEQGILTEKVKVALKTTADWADYVFAPDYKLMPLSEVEKYTIENKHLPNVPSATEMVANGLDVAQTDAKLLEKIEELTLYLIQQQKQIEELKAQVTTLASQKK